jgi:hypothetical protein
MNVRKGDTPMDAKLKQLLDSEVTVYSNPSPSLRIEFLGFLFTDGDGYQVQGNPTSESFIGFMPSDVQEVNVDDLTIIL